MKAFGQGVDGIGLKREGRICCANTQDGQAKLPKAVVVGGRHDPGREVGFATQFCPLAFKR